MTTAIAEGETTQLAGTTGEGEPTGRRYFLTRAGKESAADGYRAEDDPRLRQYTRSRVPQPYNVSRNLCEYLRLFGHEPRTEDAQSLELFVSQQEASRLLGVTRAAVSARVKYGSLRVYVFREHRWVWLPEAVRKGRSAEGYDESDIRTARERDAHGLGADQRRRLREGVAGSLDFWQMDSHLAARAQAMAWAAMLDGDAVAVMRETGLDYLFALETVRLMFHHGILSVEDDGLLIRADWLDDGLGGEISFVLDAMLLDGLLTLDPEESAGEELTPAEPPQPTAIATPPPAGHEAYDMRSTYRDGQKLWHRLYGSGTVRHVRGNKIDVAFGDRPRTLIHSLAR